MALHYIVLVCR